jgi:hypothetical protein
MMNRTTEKLLKRVEKAGVRKSLKEGHVLGKEDLLAMKVQIVPNYLRIVLGLGALVSGIFSWLYWTWDSPEPGVLLGLTSLILFLFAVFGIRRTLSGILDGMDATSGAELLGAAVEGVFSAVGAIFDGV